jgi:hypothetical protein
MSKEMPKESEQKIRVTVKLAKEWLETNEGNRNLREGHVAKLASDMADGKFLYTAEPIKFDDSTPPQVIDGQHRLAAIIRSGKPQRMLIVTGIPRDHRKAMDQGAKRSVADNLRMDAGVVNSHQITAIARLLMRWMAGDARNASKQPSDMHVYDFVMTNHAELADAASYSGATRKLGGSPQAVGAVYFASLAKDSKVALTFWEKVRTGANCTETDPALLLRNALHQLSRSPRMGSKPVLTLELCIRAWNLMREGAKQTSILVKPLNTIPDRNFTLK